MGKPLKYTPEQIETLGNKYFKWCDTIEGKPYTISGLCLYLDINRSTLLRYEEREEYCNTIKKLKLKVENYIEEASLKGSLNATTCIFNLKNNFGWKDKHEVDNNITMEKNPVNELIKSIKDLKDEETS